MSKAMQKGAVPLRSPEMLFIDGTWVEPCSDARIQVIDSATEEVYFEVASAQAADMDRAIGAARRAFDEGPWPRLSHAERAEYLTGFAQAWRDRTGDVGEIWPRESGALRALVDPFCDRSAEEWDYCAGLATTYPFEEPAPPTAGGAFGLLVHEPVGVVGAIIPWNGPVSSIAHKIAPALLTGCTAVLKASPEAPGEALMAAEIAEALGLPPGVLNVVCADREASELLVTDPRVDKIAFTGSTATGRRIGALCAERVARCNVELGGKSPAVILDDADIAQTAATLAGAECMLSGQVCSSLTRIIITQDRHDEFIDALAAEFGSKVVGDPYDPETQMGPLASAIQRERVEGYIAKGVSEGGKLVAGGGRPQHLERGFYIEPTLFANVDNSATIAQEEIFGPVLSVIPAADEEDAIRIANDTIYGLNASVFTPDVDRARAVAGRIRAGTVGHNAFRTDFGVSFGGYKQSGIGREGGLAGLRLYLETKFVVLDDTPAEFAQ